MSKTKATVCRLTMLKRIEKTLIDSFRKIVDINNLTDFDKQSIYIDKNCNSMTISKLKKIENRKRKIVDQSRFDVFDLIY